MFLNCSDISEAHKLSSLCFGIFSPRHIKCNIERKTESINSGIFDEEPFVYKIKPRIRNYREKGIRTPIKSNEERKVMMLDKIMKERQQEKSIMDSFIKDGYIKFDSLPFIESHVRITLLRWLSKGINSPDGRGKTEYGMHYRVILPSSKDMRCTLNCQDGIFEMPSYTIYFEPESGA